MTQVLGLSVDQRRGGNRVTVEGIVLSGVTGNPISGATVTALDPRGESVSSSADTGEWSLACEAGTAGVWRIRVEESLHVPREVEWPRRAGKETEVRMPPVFLLPIAARIRGCVVGPTGEPVPLAEVRVLHSGQSKDLFFAERSGVHRLRANEKGGFGPVLVPVGTVTIRANSVDLPDCGVSVLVEPGPVRTIEIEVVLPSSGFATGHVVDGEGRPLQATVVGWVQEVRTDPEGRFRVPLLPGEFVWLSARGEGFLSPYAADRRVQAGDDVRIELRRALDLWGRVLEPDGSPARAGLSVRGEGATASTGPEGEFRLGLLPAGECDIVVTEGHQVIQGKFSVVLDEGIAREGLVLRLPRPIGFIEGIVLGAESEKPLEGVKVGSQVTGADGRFRIPVGDRESSRIGSLTFSKEGYRSLRREWRGLGESRLILLTRRGDVRVRAVDENGKPVVGAVIECISYLAPAFGWTDTDGVASLPVPWGARLLAFHRVAGAGEVEPTVEPGMVTDAGDITLRWPTTIRVTDESKVALPNAYLRLPSIYNEVVHLADGAGVIRTWATRGFVSAPGREVVELVRDSYGDPWRTEEITFRLRPSVPVTGRLLDPHGRPLPGRSISGAPGGDVTTDGRGRFRIQGIPVGHSVDLVAELDDGIRVTANVVGGDPDVVMQTLEMRRIRVRLTEIPPGTQETRGLAYLLYESLGHGVLDQVANGTLALEPEDRIVTLTSPSHADVLKLRCEPGTWRIYRGLHRQDTEIEYDFPESGKAAIRVEDAEGESIEGATIREAGTGAVLGQTDDTGVWISMAEVQIPSAVLPLVVGAEGFVEEVIAARDLSTKVVERVSLRTGGAVSGRIVGASWGRIVALLPEGVPGESAEIYGGRFRFRHHLSPGTRLLLVCPVSRKPFIEHIVVKEGESTEVVIKSR